MKGSRLGQWACALVVLMTVAVSGTGWAQAQSAAGSESPSEGGSGEPSKLRLDVGLTLSRFEQQVKTEIGGARAPRLVAQTELGLLAAGTWRVWGPLSLGAFVQLDGGTREVGRFSAVNDEGQAVVDDTFGGSYLEFWAGPLLRVSWRSLFLETGYGLVGIRMDEARDDLPDDRGSDESALRTSRTVAWLAAVGAGVPLTESLELVLRLEYRVRYYDRRGDRDLVSGVVHGTQNFTPFFGLAWSP